ncbi:MAG: 23S rRNA (guanosine(2251)-2'-O)-methyltransferase RlmB [Campylobacterota bacterium]|nr:23S rRNA (guanosine(2251)-2'-O)-methyltransferase RlmB [Campylobacterota bacterium]
MNDSPEYLAKKAFYDRVLTIYGRNAVMEALEDKNIIIHKLHLSKSNRSAPQLDEMVKVASRRGIEVVLHDKNALSRISRNAKQDQGVALDLLLEHYMDEGKFISNNINYRLIALDGIHNPQNLGMIIRSCAAGQIDGIILPTKNSAKISPLVIKASAGTLFKLPIIKTNDLAKTLKHFQREQAKLYTLSSHAKKSYREQQYSDKAIFILGNESEGVSQEIKVLCDENIVIPMNRNVESLNVAVTASLLAFL